VIIDLFSLVEKWFRWFQTVGLTILSKKRITYNEWRRLSERIRSLNEQICIPMITNLHLAVLEKSAESLVAFTKLRPRKHATKHRETCARWFRDLERHLEFRRDWADPDPFKFKRDCITQGQRWKVVDMLVPAAQFFKEEYRLESLADLRFDIDFESREKFIKQHKNW
jgi:hypothetical protein